MTDLNDTQDEFEQCLLNIGLIASMTNILFNLLEGGTGDISERDISGLSLLAYTMLCREKENLNKIKTQLYGF